MLPVSVFSELVWQSVLLYWYDVYNIFFFPSPTIVIRLVITPKQKKKQKKRKRRTVEVLDLKNEHSVTVQTYAYVFF